MLGILTTHPIQYQVPIWKLLAARGRVPVRVYFMSDQGLAVRPDPEFGREFAWDIDLCGGYDHEFVGAVARRQHGFLSMCLNDRMRDVLLTGQIRVLWIQGWQVAAYWQAASLANRAGISTWLRGETNLNSSGSGRLKVARNFALDRLFSRVDHFLYIGAANCAFYRSRGISDPRLAPAPYCVDTGEFARQAAAMRGSRPALRAQWGIPEDAFCFLFVGKFIGKKRPLDLVAAAHRLQQKLGRPIHLLWVGTGELGERIRSGCRIVHDAERPLPDGWSQDRSGARASFAGFLNQSQLAKAYIAADCLVLPSEGTETWGLVVNEAMSCGIPAIVSDAVGCAPDLVQSFRPDLCFPVGDIDALAHSMSACIERPPPLTDIKYVIDRYDVAATVETIERLYAGIAATRQSAPLHGEMLA